MARRLLKFGRDTAQHVLRSTAAEYADLLRRCRSRTDEQGECAHQKSKHAPTHANTTPGQSRSHVLLLVARCTRLKPPFVSHRPSRDRTTPPPDAGGRPCRRRRD